MRVSAISICLLLVCIYRTANAGRRLRPRILEGEGINFPRRTLSKTQAANCVSSIFSVKNDMIDYYGIFFHVHILD